MPDISIGTTVSYTLIEKNSSFDQKLEITAGSGAFIDIVWHHDNPNSPNYKTKTFQIVKLSRGLIKALDNGQTVTAVFEVKDGEVQPLTIHKDLTSIEANSTDTIIFALGNWRGGFDASEVYDILNAIAEF